MERLQIYVPLPLPTSAAQAAWTAIATPSPQKTGCSPHTNDIDGYKNAAMRLTSIESSVTFTAIVPGAYPGEAKMCLSLITETDADDSHPSCI